MNIAVVGLGKIGLPLAVHFADKGNQVLGADINQLTVDSVNAGIEPFPEEKDLAVRLADVVGSGHLKATVSVSEAVSKSEVVIVVVPLFADSSGAADFRALDSVSEQIGKNIRKGTLVSYETTLPIGTTRNRLAAIISKISNLKVGIDFFVTFSPERVLTGRIFSDLRKYPKIVGGVTPKCAQVGVDFYSQNLDFDERHDLQRKNGVWLVDSAESAEFVKLAETTYRDVNIALSNQFAMHADKLGISLPAIIEAANSQPYSHLHNPGIAVGGHCIPIYPQFYLLGDTGASIVRTARALNSSMPEYAVRKIEARLGSVNGLKVLISGASYRDGVKELAFSGVYGLLESLKQRGATVEVFDPLFTGKELEQAGIPQLIDSFEQFDVVILQTESQEFISILADANVFSNLKLILDGRNVLSGKSHLYTVPILGIGN